MGSESDYCLWLVADWALTFKDELISVLRQLTDLKKKKGGVGGVVGGAYDATEIKTSLYPCL